MSEENNSKSFVDKDVFEGIGSLQSQIFDNALILSNILKYSNLSDLKIFRTVSKFWNEIANSFLKLWTKLTFIIRQNDNSSALCQEDIPFKIQTFETLKLQNFKITSTEGNDKFSRAVCFVTTIKPVVEIFSDFFQKCNTQIVNIELDIKSENESSKQIIQSLFKACKNFNKITLDMELSHILQNEPQPITSAKIVEIFCEQENYEILLKIFPAMQELGLSCKSSYHFLPISSTPIYQQLLKNLKIIRIDGFFPAYLDRYLADLPVDLEELEFFNWHPNPNNYSFSRFSNSLLKLSVCINTLGYDICCSVYFPKMEKLETLRILCQTPKNVNRWEFKWELAAATFPKLKRLEIVCWEDGEHFKNNFLTEENSKQFPNLESAFLCVLENTEDFYQGIKRLENNFVTWVN